MTLPQESLVSSSQDAFGFPEESKSITDVSELVKLLKNNACARYKLGMEMPMGLTIEDDNSSENKQSFPWLSRFSQLCREAVGSQSIKLLENLISVYLRNVSEDVQQCYKKPKRAGKLKTKINDALKLFHMLYSDIKKPLEYTFYLDKMSDLMAMYIDMEIKASRRSKESPKKISQRLTSSLFIFLDNSPDHILDSILKAKFFTKKFKEICIPILIRILRDSPGRIMYEMTYVRYLLAFKLWKRLVEKKEARIEINKLAIAKLIPPFDFLDKLRSGQFSGVLPYVAKSEKDRMTSFLMQAPFNVKEKAEVFLKACRDPKEGMLVVHPATDLEKSLFFSEDIKFSSEPDPKVDGTSMTLMNSIWSSMANTDDTGPGDCFRLCNELSFKPKNNKKGCKKLKDKLLKSKSIVTSHNEKTKKKKKCKELENDANGYFVHEVKPKMKDEAISMKIKDFVNLQGKDGGRKIKTEKIYDEVDAFDTLRSKFDEMVQTKSGLTPTGTIEEIRLSIKKDLDAVECCDDSDNNFREIDAVSDTISTIKIDTDAESCSFNKQTNINNQRDNILSASSSKETDSNLLFLNTRKPIEGSLCTNSRGNLDISSGKLDQSTSDPDLTIKTIDLDSIMESTEIKTEIIDESESCVIINDDDDEEESEEARNQIDGEPLDVSKIAQEVEIGSESVDVCVPEHIQNDRLDSLLENDITDYPTIPGSELFNASKDMQNDMQTSFSRDICIADQYLEPSSFFEGNNEDVVSQVLCDWPNQGNIGLYKEHDNNYIPNVLLRSDINLGYLFPEVTIDNEEEEEDEEINYQAQGQYARGAKVGFRDMATIEENETEWETRDPEYDELSPISRDDSNRSISSSVINNSPQVSVESETQSFVINQSPTVDKQKMPTKDSDNHTSFEVNGGYDLSKLQQVSVNLKQVAYEIAEKLPTKEREKQRKKKSSKTSRKRSYNCDEVPDQRLSKEDSPDLDDMPLVNRGKVVEEIKPKRSRTRKTRHAPSPPPLSPSPPSPPSPPVSRRKGRSCSSNSKPAKSSKSRKRRR